MMNMKKILVLIVLFALSFAQFQELLNAHYQASKDENWDAYIATFDTSDMGPGALTDMRSAVEAVWGAYDTDSFRVTGLSSVLDGKGYALLKYNLTLTISNAQGSFTNNMEYVALCRQSGTKWKLLYSMPLADYLDFTDSIGNTTSTMVAAESYYNKTTKEPVGNALASMDGAAPAYSADTEAAEAPPTGAGASGETTPGKGCCGSAFILAFAALGAFALSSHKE